jgi:Zn-dependent M16 (insulinase) family peptidase
MYDLLQTLVLETDFDGQEAELKIQQLLQTMASSATDEMSESGHAYASRYASSMLTAEGELKEQTSGVSQLKLVTELARRTEAGSLRDVIERLKIIQSIALSKSKNLRMAITCGTESAETNEAQLNKFLAKLPGSVANLSLNATKSNFTRNAKTFFPLPYQVYYSGLSIPGVPYVDASGAALSILARLLTHNRLHHEIREKGGAYGGGAMSNSLGGTFGFYSYRDPNPRNTLKIMRDSGAWAMEQDFSSRDIEEAKLSIFQGIDSPESVNQEGMLEFVSGIDPDMAQCRREQLLDVTAEDVKKAADELVSQRMKDAKIAVLGPKFLWWDEVDWKQTPLLTKAAANITSEKLPV